MRASHFFVSKCSSPAGLPHLFFEPQNAERLQKNEPGGKEIAYAANRLASLTGMGGREDFGTAPGVCVR
ncbi:MAG: hypothetical protein LBD18_03605, partial [Treponema sp.]|nr:hypothetical protein [Treponema sp.]